MNNQIALLLPPPREPRDPPTCDSWEQVHSQYGQMPLEFIMFVSRYGTGLINGFIRIWNPSASKAYLHFFYQVPVVLQALKHARSEGSLEQVALFPEGGLFPFGSTDNGDIICWRTVGSPEFWTVSIVDSRQPQVEHLPVPFSGFIADFLTGHALPRSFPEDSVRRVASFAPERA